jgi:hypothetical protein
MDTLTQEEVDALLRAVSTSEEYTDLRYGVVVGGKAYCYDVLDKRCVAIELKIKSSCVVPEEVEKLIAMKRFNLVEKVVEA